MTTEKIIEAMQSLTADELEPVYELIQSLKARRPPETSLFLGAVDEVIAQHPELLRRLAK